MRPWSLSGAQGLRGLSRKPAPLCPCRSAAKVAEGAGALLQLTVLGSGFRVSGTQWHWAQKNPKRVPGCLGFRVQGARAARAVEVRACGGGGGGVRPFWPPAVLEVLRS